MSLRMNGARFIVLLAFAAPRVVAQVAFCNEELFEDYTLCDDGQPMKENGCCADNRGCPSSCIGAVAISESGCTCSGCTKRRKMMMTSQQQFLNAHNFFRCLHGVQSLVWNGVAAENAQLAVEASCKAGALAPTTNPALLSLPAGENLHMGLRSPEEVGQLWHTEADTAADGKGYIPSTVAQDAQYAGSPVDHYTAMIWRGSTELGCAFCQASDADNSMIWGCHYVREASNVGNLQAYIANVPQSSVLSDAAACCAQVYNTSITDWSAAFSLQGLSWLLLAIVSLSSPM